MASGTLAADSSLHAFAPPPHGRPHPLSTAPPFRESSPPELTLNTPSPTSSAPATSSEGVSSDPERDAASTQSKQHSASALSRAPAPSMHPDMPPAASDALSNARTWHQPDMPAALTDWSQSHPHAHAHDAHDAPGNDAMFDEMICADSVGPATSQPGPSAPPQACADAGAESNYTLPDASQLNLKQEPSTPSVSATEPKDDASVVGSSVAGPGVYPHAIQKRSSEAPPNPAQFGMGSHYSHTSDSDLGYTAKTIVRPPRDQLGNKLQVHVHGVALIGAKSRVETQIRMRIELVRKKAYYAGGPDPRYGEELAPDLGMTSPQAISTAHARFGPPELWQRIGSFTHVKLPPGTGTRRKTRKHKEPQVDPQDTLFLDATVVNASPPHNRAYVCEGCRTRERKRILRMKGRSKRNGDAAKAATDSAADTGSGEGVDGDRKANGSEQEELPTTEEIQALGIDPSLPNAVELALAVREERARERVVVFNTGDYVEFHNGEAVLPTRITCYCRHHKEKIGFCIIFTLRDWTGQLLATGTTPPIMITDDHKTSQGPQAQAQMQAQADALAEVLAQAHANKVASLRAQGITPPPNFQRPSLGGDPSSVSPHSMPHPSYNLDAAGNIPAQDSTIGRMARQRRKSSTSRCKPYARNPSIASSSQTNSAAARPAQRRPSRISPGLGDTVMSPASNEGTAQDFDTRMSIASVQPEAPQYSRNVVSPIPAHEAHHAASPVSSQGTIPTGPMPLSAFQPGLAQDTLRPMAETGPFPSSDAQGNGLAAPPDSAMLLQAYTFARAQAEAAFGNNPLFFNSQGQPNPHVYAAMVSAMQALNNGQQLPAAGLQQGAQQQPPMVQPPPLTAPNHRPSVASVVERPMDAPGAAPPALQPSSGAPNEGGIPTPTPKIHQLIPREGPTTGGIEVTVLGENFVEGISAVFGDQPAISTKVWAHNTLVCLLPPASSPGPVIVSFRLPNVHYPNVPDAEEQAPPLAFFTYVELADRSLMELALQVVGLKMTGQMHSARDVAMRVVGTGAERGGLAASGAGGGPSDTGTEGRQHCNGAVASQFSVLARAASSGSSKSLNFQGSLLSLLAMSDEQVPPAPAREDEEREHNPPWVSSARLAPEQRGDAIRLTNQAGQTLLHLAVVLGFSRLVDDLLRRGAPVNARDRCGMTPLHFAAMHGRTSVTRRLLINFADPFARMRSGLSALELARMAGQDDTVALLEAHFALVASSPLASEDEDLSESFSVDGWETDEYDLATQALRARCTSIDEDNVSSHAVSESEPDMSEDPIEVAPTLVPTTSQETGSSWSGIEKPRPAVTANTEATAHRPDSSNKSSSASEEKKALAARLAVMAPETAPRKFGLSKLQRFLSPAAFTAAPISVFRMDLPSTEPVLAPEAGELKKIDSPHSACEATGTGALGSSHHIRRRSRPSVSGPSTVRKRGSKGKAKDDDLDNAVIVSPSAGVKGGRRSPWWEDRMLVLFWLPALFVALVVCLLVSIGPIQHLFDTLRQGSLFKLYPDERAL